MLMSHSHKFIFIHIWKTGGTSIREALKPFCQDSPMCPQHTTARDIADAYPNEWREYKKFTVIRNPWDLIVSLYYWLRQNDAHDLHRFALSLSFDEFLCWLSNTEMEYPEWSEHGSAKIYRRTQTNFISDILGRPSIDKAVRFENLHDGFKGLCEEFGLGEVCLPHIGASQHQYYRDCYSSCGREIVRNLFKEDIVNFGYRF